MVKPNDSQRANAEVLSRRGPYDVPPFLDRPRHRSYSWPSWALRFLESRRARLPIGRNAKTPFARRLEAAGCRYTTQRAAVFGFLERVKTHPTAEEVYLAVRRALPRISLATVYKALERASGRPTGDQAEQRRRLGPL